MAQGLYITLNNLNQPVGTCTKKESAITVWVPYIKLKIKATMFQIKLKFNQLKLSLKLRMIGLIDTDSLHGNEKFH
jgi:hypothetical protein